MHEKDQKFTRKWQKQQQKGKTSYMLTYGVLWGIIAAIVSTLFRLGNSSLSELYLSTNFLIKLIIMIAVGVLFYGWQWSYNTKKYDKLLREHPNHPDTSHTSAH